MVVCASLNKCGCIKFKTVLKDKRLISLKFEEVMHIDLLNLGNDREEVKENFKILILGN